jgi:hypothetical protein
MFLEDMGGNEGYLWMSISAHLSLGTGRGGRSSMLECWSHQTWARWDANRPTALWLNDEAFTDPCPADTRQTHFTDSIGVTESKEDPSLYCALETQVAALAVVARRFRVLARNKE